VWFDRHDEGRVENVSSRLFARCHFSESRAISLAVKHLRDTGHREVAYLCHDTRSDWRLKRLEDLKVEASRRGDMRVRGILPPTGFFDCLYEDAFPGFLSRLRAFTSPNVEQALRRLASFLPKVEEWSRLPRGPRPKAGPVPLREWESYISDLTPRLTVPRVPPTFIMDAVTVLRTIRGTDIYQHFGDLTNALSLAPGLTKALSRKEISALIAPCDLDARNIFTWIQQSGLNMPDQISLLSFDNSPSISGYPVTTLDFGFGYLGYAAFHFLFHDVPIKRNRYGEIPARPHLVHRGSVKYIRS
jgi:hypothetical protein